MIYGRIQVDLLLFDFTHLLLFLVATILLVSMLTGAVPMTTLKRLILERLLAQLLIALYNDLLLWVHFRLFLLLIFLLLCLDIVVSPGTLVATEHCCITRVFSLGFQLLTHSLATLLSERLLVRQVVSQAL